MSYRIPLFDLNYGVEEEQAALAVLRSRWISMGEKTAELERRFAAHIGVPHAVALSSCTAALHLAVCCVAGPGDEAIVPSFTFVATVNAVRFAGATPVFADVRGPEDLTLDPDDVRKRITPRTRAIVVMHYAGFPCDMDAIGAIAAEHELAVIEDAAHAPNTRFGDRPAGGLGALGCFSFFSNKNVSCGEGGMLTTAGETFANRARLMRSHGMTSLSYDRARGHATDYDVIEPGFNYRIDDIRAALALAQLDRLDDDTRRRRALRERYIERLDGIAELTIPFRDSPHQSSNYIFVVLLRSGGTGRRDAVRAKLADAGIQTSVHYPAVHRFSIYAGDNRELERTEHAADHAITLPLFTRMTEPQVDEVCEAVKRTVR
jgi:dTDP-4-amino-4,6-dideoxygalactose transaminase